MGLVLRHRGYPSHRRISERTRGRIEALLRPKYVDFGASLAAEKPRELDAIKVSVETVRRIQIGLGLWRPKTRRARRVFQLRQCQPRLGELIQIDGGPHDWFEGHGPRCTLIVFIDDATGRLTTLRFAPVGPGAAYLAALRDHGLTHGRRMLHSSTSTSPRSGCPTRSWCWRCRPTPRNSTRWRMSETTFMPTNSPAASGTATRRSSGRAPSPGIGW
ncbi:hypothetical protein [Rhodopila sp.]|uniref:hypothetical protein n=1 Tax=Rhodopila sp. TaxID=2480087 RepID=UPI003D0D4E9D